VASGTLLKLIEIDIDVTEESLQHLISQQAFEGSILLCICFAIIE